MGHLESSFLPTKNNQRIFQFIFQICSAMEVEIVKMQHRLKGMDIV